MKFFCKSETLSPLVALAAFDAGYLLAKNDRDLAVSAISVVDGILALIDKGSDAGSINAAFQEAVKALVNEHVKDPLVKMNLLAVLEMVGIEITAPDMKVLEVGEIKGLVSNFKAGVLAYK